MSRKGALDAALDAARKAGFEHVVEEALVIFRQDIAAVGLQGDEATASVTSVARQVIRRAMKSYEEFIERMNRAAWEE